MVLLHMITTTPHPLFGNGDGPNQAQFDDVNTNTALHTQLNAGRCAQDGHTCNVVYQRKATPHWQPLLKHSDGRSNTNDHFWDDSYRRSLTSQRPNANERTAGQTKQLAMLGTTTTTHSFPLLMRQWCVHRWCLQTGYAYYPGVGLRKPVAEAYHDKRWGPPSKAMALLDFCCLLLALSVVLWQHVPQAFAAFHHVLHVIRR